MSTTTTTEKTSEILIPSLPNDVALQCLARVPRQYHPVLSAVSKPIRSLVSSPAFFALRSALNCTEHLLYFRIRSLNFQPARWFTLYRRPNENSVTGNIIMAPVRGTPNDRLDWSEYVAEGPKIYVLGGKLGRNNSAEVWIFDCRFHKWERGPSMPPARKFGARAVVHDGMIYVFGHVTTEGSWADVFDTVTGSWEALRSPELKVYNKLVAGCGIRGGKVCVWVNGEELRFDPVTKTWEVFRFGMPWFSHICDVNGVLCCYDDHINTFKGFDEEGGVWKQLKLENGGFSNPSLNPNQLLVYWMVGVGGRLVIMGVLRDEHGSSELEGRMGVWCVEIEVKKDTAGDFRGEVLWWLMVFSMRAWLFDRVSSFNTCIPVSL